MGNYISCRNLATPMIITPRAAAARVILLGGEIRQFRQLVKAAELMLESPNCFLVNSKLLKIGKRFRALPVPADEDLEFGNVYIMFPMRRLNSCIVTAADVLMAANPVSKRISGGKVKPLAAGTVDYCLEECEMGRSNSNSRLNLDEIEGFEGIEYRCMIVACRSRKPMLDTIVEEG